MGEWHCENCKLNFSEKPTFTTTCPECKERLFTGKVEGFVEYGAGELDSGYCAWCGKVLRAAGYELEIPRQFDENRTSKFIHKKCHRLIQNKNYEGLEESKETFKKTYRLIETKKGVSKS